MNDSDLRRVGKAEKELFDKICKKSAQSIANADVRPVIHSFWGYNPGDNIPYCDNCGMPQDARSDFCHCCGADMRPTSVSGAKELSKPRWIPVTEALPKTRESILGKKSSKVIVAFCFDDGTQGTDTAHTLNGEWVFEDHITVVTRTITHWMPLPEPPKEET